MKRTKKVRIILFVALLFALLTTPSITQANYCGPFPNHSYPPTYEECSYMYDYCMCDCVSQTGDRPLCLSACYQWVIGEGCQYW